MQAIVRECRRVPEHHLLREKRVVQSLQHALHQHQKEQKHAILRGGSVVRGLGGGGISFESTKVTHLLVTLVLFVQLLEARSSRAILLKMKTQTMTREGTILVEIYN